MGLLPPLRALTSFSLYLVAVTAFSVSVGTPTQCDPLSVSWTGGQAPFQIILLPVNSTPRSVTVPSTAFSNNQGSYQVAQLPFPTGYQFLLTISDATGFGTGGLTDILTVGAQVGGNNCNTTILSPDFYFSVTGEPEQCSPYTFYQYDGAILPVTITGLIPFGDSFNLYPGATATSYTWTADVAAGTDILFMMADSQGRTGGISPIESVNPSNDNSCLNADVPSSTTSSPASSPTSFPATSSSSSSRSSSSTLSTGTIAGVAAGAFAVVAGLVALSWFCIRKRRKNRSLYVTPAPRKLRRSPAVDLDSGYYDSTPGPAYPFPSRPNAATIASPIPAGSAIASSLPPDTTSVPVTSARQTQYSHVSSNISSLAAHSDVMSASLAPSSPSAPRSAATTDASGNQTATHFIIHTDAEDVVPTTTEVVELPPRYSERLSPQLSVPLHSRSMSLATLHASSDLTHARLSYVDESHDVVMHPPPFQ